jgi:hypothetical protein
MCDFRLAAAASERSNMTVEQLAEELTNRECVLIFKTLQEIEILGEKLCQFHGIRDKFSSAYLKQGNGFASWIHELPACVKSDPARDYFSRIPPSLPVSCGTRIYYANEFICSPEEAKFELESILSSM